MANAFSGISRTINVICDTVKLFEGLDAVVCRINENSHESDMAKASLVNRLILLGFTITEVGMILSGKNAKSLAKLKNVEIIPRVINIPFEYTLQAAKRGGDQTLRNILSVIQRGVIEPIADAARVSAQCTGYEEAHYLEMSPEELAKAQRPIYEYVGSGPEDSHYKIVGYKPVEKEECIANLEQANRTVNQTSLIRIGSIVFDPAAPLYDQLYAFITASQIQGQFNQQNQAAIHAQALDLEFPNFPSIPLPLHGDAIFSQFICPINLVPIRDPVRDPTTPDHVKVIYERQAILNWLQLHQTSPWTQQPLQTGQLIECPALKLVIDQRLQHHYQQMVQHLEAANNLPINPQNQLVIQQHIQ